MYQHDIKETRLTKTLNDIVTECVSFVGENFFPFIFLMFHVRPVGKFSNQGGANLFHSVSNLASGGRQISCDKNLDQQLKNGSWRNVF